MFLHTIFGNYSEFLGAIFRNYSVINNKKREFGINKPAMAFNSKLSMFNLNISLYLYSSMFLITSCTEPSRLSTTPTTLSPNGNGAGVPMIERARSRSSSSVTRGKPA